MNYKVIFSMVIVLLLLSFGVFSMTDTSTVYPAWIISNNFYIFVIIAVISIFILYNSIFK